MNRFQRILQQRAQATLIARKIRVSHLPTAGITTVTFSTTEFDRLHIDDEISTLYRPAIGDLDDPNVEDIHDTDVAVSLENVLVQMGLQMQHRVRHERQAMDAFTIKVLTLNSGEGVGERHMLVALPLRLYCTVNNLVRELRKHIDEIKEHLLDQCALT